MSLTGQKMYSFLTNHPHPLKGQGLKENFRFFEMVLVHRLISATEQEVGQCGFKVGKIPLFGASIVASCRYCKAAIEWPIDQGL